MYLFKKLIKGYWKELFGNYKAYFLEFIIF